MPKLNKIKRITEHYQTLATDDADEVLEVRLLYDAVFGSNILTSYNQQQPEAQSNTSDGPQVLLQEGALPPLTTKQTAQLAFAFLLLWFIANWTLNVALDLTSVASATILSTMSGMFTPKYLMTIFIYLFTHGRIFHPWYWSTISSGETKLDQSMHCGYKVTDELLF